MNPSARPPLGHRPVVPSRIGKRPGPIAEEDLRAFAQFPVADLSDAVGRLYTMANELKPLYAPMRRVIGAALTVKAVPGDNWAIHAALSMAGAGDVVVIDWRSDRESCGAGALAVLPAVQRGLAGVVIDGGWRDVEEVKALGLPIIATGVAPFSPTKAALGEINVPVACGGVVVEPGDLIIGDSDGTVVVPRRSLAAVSTELRARADSRTRSAGAESSPEAVLEIADRYWAEFDRGRGVRE